MSTPITTRYLVGPAELLDAVGGDLTPFGDVGVAVAYADATGGTVWQCRPMPESGLWEWTVTRAGETPHDRVVYVNERAARNSATPGCTVWKARVGHRPLQWQPVDNTL